MQIIKNFFSDILRYLSRNKKLTIILIIIVAVSATSITAGIDFSFLGAKQAADASSLLQSEDDRTIAQNIEKYSLKTDWLEAHPQELQVSTDASLILDYETREILFAQDIHEQNYPASITKILTALVVLENMDTGKLCTVSEKAAKTEANHLSLAEGEQLYVNDLLYALMMFSANDAAVVLAECYDGGSDAFMAKMNERVRLLGLTESNFVTPNGLHDDNHYTTAYDMAVITKYAIATQPSILDYMGRTEDYSIPVTEHNSVHWFYCLSSLLKTYQGMDGAKTGFTYEAGNTYVATAERDGRRIIIVYFDAFSKTYDATLLLDQGFFLESLIAKDDEETVE